MAEADFNPPAQQVLAGANLPAVIHRNEHIVKRGFWAKARRVVRLIPFSEDLFAAYFCAMDDATPARVRAVLLAALAYFVVPTDLVPDFIAGLGFTDDATVIATVIGIVSGHIKPRHRDQARRALGNAPAEAAASRR